MRNWMTDLRLALLGMRKSPLFTLAVVLTLALAVGANTALFGVFRTVFLEPIPLPGSDRLVVIEEKGGFGCCGPASGPDYKDWEERDRAFSGIAALNLVTANLTGLAEPQRIRGTYVTASAFDLLGVAPLLGRALVPEDQDSESVVVLSYAMWKNVLGGRPDVLGSAVELNGARYTVAGVMPEGFDVPSPWSHLQDFQFYLPFQNQWLGQDRGSHSFPVIARLAPGATEASAQADMDRLMRELAAEYPATNADRGVRVSTLHERLFGNVGRQLGLILGAAALVLLIACGNVAGLQLARAAGRETELAVRAALGASKRALARLLFSESLLLAALGGLGGILLSFLVVDGLRAVLPATIPRIDQVRIDRVALAFGLGATAFTAFAFGTVPALLASRSDLAASVREGGRSTLAPRKERIRDYFIVGQIALGLVLANGAVLLVRSYATLRQQDYGFRADGVLTVALNPSGPRYQKGEELESYYDEVRRQVASLPGITSVATVSKLPLAGGVNGSVWVEGRPPRNNEGEGPLVEVSSVTGDYFETMGIPLHRGRLLIPDDSTAAAVGVVVNQHLADEAWPGEDPLGKRFSFSDDPPQWLTVVGVVGDVRQWQPERDPVGEAYAPFVHGWATSQYLVVRTAGDPASLAPPVRRAVLAVDPSQPPAAAATMQSQMQRTFAQRRFYTTLIGLFALAALLLAAAGVYATVSYFVTRRIREVGIRMALGAGWAEIMGLVVRRGVRLAAWGVAIGLAGVWATTAFTQALVYRIGVLDPPTLLAGALTLAAVAVAAAALPGLRAARVPPVLALRSE
jgi:putative ABC transport system permease protein